MDASVNPVDLINPSTLNRTRIRSADQNDNVGFRVGSKRSMLCQTRILLMVFIGSTIARLTCRCCLLLISFSAESRLHIFSGFFLLHAVMSKPCSGSGCANESPKGLKYRKKPRIAHGKLQAQRTGVLAPDHCSSCGLLSATEGTIVQPYSIDSHN